MPVQQYNSLLNHQDAANLTFTEFATNEFVSNPLKVSFEICLTEKAQWRTIKVCPGTRAVGCSQVYTVRISYYFEMALRTWQFVHSAAVIILNLENIFERSHVRTHSWSHSRAHLEFVLNLCTRVFLFRKTKLSKVRYASTWICTDQSRCVRLQCLRLYSMLYRRKMNQSQEISHTTRRFIFPGTLQKLYIL